ncbi:MAG: DUF4126 domain-containing protein [Flavobacteriia bacterium]|nr:MAG: DUF4126 domain-containing protein [Flavobacteriia bacterium]
MDFQTVLSIFLGIGLAASVGFRIFLPFFVLSIASYFQIIPLNENWQWIGSQVAMITLGVATVVEILAYLIPWVDHILDVIAVPLAAVSGTAIMLSTVSDIDPFFTWILAIIAGGGTAAAIKTSTSTTRLASTATTAGFANPVISLVETVTSVLLSLMSVFVPVLAIVLLIVIFRVIYKMYHKMVPTGKNKT